MTEIAYSPPAALEGAVWLSLETMEPPADRQLYGPPCAPCHLEAIESYGHRGRLYAAEYRASCRYSDGEYGQSWLCADCAREVERRLAAAHTEGSTR